VQPIVVTTTVFAVFVRSALDRTLPDRAEIVWAVCTWVGLTLFVATAGGRRPGFVTSDRTAALFLVAAAVAVALAMVVARQMHVPARRGFFLGVAAGILYGSTAGLVKVATSYARSGAGPLLHHWSAWLVPPAGLSAFFLSQRAFQASRLSVSVPVLNIVDVLVAVAFGSIVFREHPFRSPGQLLVELVGATMIVVGVWRLVREGERLHERLTARPPQDRLGPPRVTRG
jgi:small-conductance mechanosensitive channel